MWPSCRNNRPHTVALRLSGRLKNRLMPISLVIHYRSYAGFLLLMETQILFRKYSASGKRLSPTTLFPCSCNPLAFLKHYIYEKYIDFSLLLPSKRDPRTTAHIP